jgi:hypothetical protein
MNERIEQLARQCTEWVTGTLDGDFEKFDYKKFAGLIVNECADEIIKQNGDVVGRDDWNRGYDAGLQDAISVIKDRFGVK